MKDDTNMPEIPGFSGKIFRRPKHYRQNVGALAELDEYTIHAYQYATSTKPGFCEPAAISRSNLTKALGVFARYSDKTELSPDYNVQCGLFPDIPVPLLDKNGTLDVKMCKAYPELTGERICGLPRLIVFIAT